MLSWALWTRNLGFWARWFISCNFWSFLQKRWFWLLFKREIVLFTMRFATFVCCKRWNRGFLGIWSSVCFLGLETTWSLISGRLGCLELSWNCWAWNVELSLRIWAWKKIRHFRHQIVANSWRENFILYFFLQNIWNQLVTPCNNSFKIFIWRDWFKKLFPLTTEKFLLQCFKLLN